MKRRRKETGAMNREATGAIVSRRAGIFDVCDCSHNVDPHSGAAQSAHPIKGEPLRLCRFFFVHPYLQWQEAR